MCYEGVTMASKPPIASSSLNPNAPVFVPAAYLAAEDFSPEWWRLIQTSTSFREWWMKERFESEEREEAAVAAAAREEADYAEIDELLELGFNQVGIFDDLEDQPPPPVAVAPQHQHQFQPHQSPRQQHQQRVQQQQQQQQLQNGTVPKQGKPQ